MRPACLIVVVGTHTEVGKTWVGRTLLQLWKAQGLRVAARKPVQSYEACATVTDAEQLAAATGEDCDTVCPRHRWYPQPLAPPMAADALGRPRIQLKALISELTWLGRADIGLVETVGGVRSPLAHDGDSADLVRCLEPDAVLLVAGSGLGTLNAIRLTLACLDGLPTQLFLNRFDPMQPLHGQNLRWLADHDGVTAITTIEALAVSCDLSRSIRSPQLAVRE